MNGEETTKRKNPGLNWIALRGMMLVIVIPFLGVLYLFWDELRSKVVPLGFLLVLSVLGFVLFWTVIRNITSIVRGLESVSRGEADAVRLENAPRQLQEMTEIINALNRLTQEFKENASQLEKFIEQFATLSEISEITARIPDIEELLTLVLRKAMANTTSRIGTVMLLREDGNGMDIVVTEGWRPQRSGPIPLSETLCRKVIEGGSPLLVEDIETAPELGRRNDPSRYSSPSFLIMPLTSKTATIGAVCLSEKAGGAAFSHHDRQFMKVLLGQIGFAVENARLLKQAREAARQLQEVANHKDQQLRAAQSQIARSERLAALGQLVAGVAHEINNPLTCIGGYAELMLQMLGDGPAAERFGRPAEVIFHEATRATRIVQNLLSFAREKKPEATSANLNDIVHRIAELRQYEFRTRGVELVTRLDPDLPPTMLDVDQMQQVLLNLVNNSMQALGGEGPQRIAIETRRAGDEVHLQVEDTGEGIPASIVDRIFDPFFSTKSGKTNTGLGLSISYGIVKRHGGDILVQSTEGRGTRMTVQLPIVPVAAAEEPPGGAKGEGARPRCGGLRALVVDDEEPIADLVALILETAGFLTSKTTQGVEALARLLAEDYDAVVCDLRIPDLDGKLLYQRVKEAKPHLGARFVFTTGDVADPETSRWCEENRVAVVAKPFTQKTLLDAVCHAVPAGSSGVAIRDKRPSIL